MQEYKNRYNIFENNQTNTFNRLAALSGLGQQTATTLGQSGQTAANNAGTILINSGRNIADEINNAAAARASGYVGGANAWSSGLTGGLNNLSLLALLGKGKSSMPYLDPNMFTFA